MVVTRRAVSISIILALLLIGILGSIPYVVSLSSYRSQHGYLGRIDGVQYLYDLVDRTHYDNLHVLIYPDTYGEHGERVHASKLDILLDDRPVEFGTNKVMLLKRDGTIVPLGWDKKWFITSQRFNSRIFGLFGPVPHFKSYEVEGFDADAVRPIIQQHTRPKGTGGAGSFSE
jgi:hypothetical protein